jgi:hypothetical protein
MLAGKAGPYGGVAPRRGAAARVVCAVKQGGDGKRELVPKNTRRETGPRKKEIPMNIHSISLVICAVLAIGSASCSKDAPSADKAAPEKTAAHAAKDVKPGSYEDWCGEHQVPESQCTKCNPTLIPAFKATGDWCEEHGLPESQCTKCNPNLKITRPAKGS